MDEQKEWQLSQGLSDSTGGIAVSVNWASSLVVVNVNGVTYQMPWQGPPPWPEDRVRVITAGLKPVCELIMGAPMGTVQSTSSSIVTVAGDDGVTYRYPHLGTAPGNSTRVRLDHAGRVVLAGAYSTEPPGSQIVFEENPLPEKPPNPGGAMWFTPAWSGNWSSGSYGNEWVTISTTRTGAYGYGTSIADSIGDDRTIRKAELHLVKNWDNYPGEVIGFGTHNFTGRPGSLTNGSLSGVYTAAGSTLVINLLGTVANALRNGTAKGIGFYSSSAGPYGWREFDRAPASGRIYMEWS